MAIPAADQNRALDFYIGTPGFELVSDETFADGSMRWIEVKPKSGTIAIAIAPPMENGPGDFGPRLRLCGLAAADDGNAATHSQSLGIRPQDRRPLGADRRTVRSILDIRPGDPPSILHHEAGTDSKARIRVVRVLENGFGVIECLKLLGR